MDIMHKSGTSALTLAHATRSGVRLHVVDDDLDQGCGAGSADAVGEIGDEISSTFLLHFEV